MNSQGAVQAAAVRRLYPVSMPLEAGIRLHRAALLLTGDRCAKGFVEKSVLFAVAEEAHDARVG